MAPDPPDPSERPAQRLFLALEIPPSVRAAVAVAVRPWREVLLSARWMAAEDWHVTVKFLGPTPAGRVSWVIDRVRAIASAHHPVAATVSALGAFPTLDRANILWAGVPDPEGGVASIARELDAGLAPTFAREGRAFAPHLTVARARPPLVLPAAYALTSLGPEPFIATEVVLFRSHLGRGAPRYERVATAALDG